MVTGIDIVKEGIRAAAGEELAYRQEDVALRGHAIECRINAEDASTNFTPAAGRIGAYKEPAGPGVRVDSGVGAGGEISATYDPMVSKLIVWDADREQATQRMLRALGEYEIEGLTTLIPFHTALLHTEEWAKGSTCKELLDDEEWLKTVGAEAVEPVDDDAPERVTQEYLVEVSGKRFDVKVVGDAPAYAAAPNGAAPKKKRGARKRGGAGGGDQLDSPLQGNMWKVLVKQGDTVEEGQLLCIIEAMKMENEITAHKAGTIAELSVAEGDAINAGEPIVTIASAAAAKEESSE